MLTRPPFRPSHRDPEAVALDAEQVPGRNAHVVEDHLAGGLGVPAHLVSDGPNDSPAAAQFDDEGRDAFGSRAAGPGHHDVDAADPGAGDELLDAGQDVLLAVPHGPGGDGRRVGTGTRFGQAVRAELHQAAQIGQIPRAAVRPEPYSSIIQAVMLWIEM